MLQEPMDAQEPSMHKILQSRRRGRCIPSQPLPVSLKIAKVTNLAQGGTDILTLRSRPTPGLFQPAIAAKMTSLST